VRRLRTLTFGLLTPFYLFALARSFPYPLLSRACRHHLFSSGQDCHQNGWRLSVTKFFGSPNKEAMYTTLLMSTGLTFGTISSLFGCRME